MHGALVERAKGGDREAFDALARAVGDQCMAIAFRILRDADRADDAVQEAMISAWRSRSCRSRLPAPGMAGHAGHHRARRAAFGVGEPSGI